MMGSAVVGAVCLGVVFTAVVVSRVAPEVDSNSVVGVAKHKSVKIIKD